MTSLPRRLDVSAYHRGSDWSRVHAVVAGVGVAGFAAATWLRGGH